MLHKSSVALLALAALLPAAPAAQAQTNIISFSFSGDSDSPSLVDPTLSAGVVPAKNYNTDNGGSQGGIADGVTYSDGTDSGLTLTYKSYDAQQNNLAKNSSYSSDGNQQLMNGFIESGPPAATNASATVTVSSVPFASYSLYVYFYNETSSLGTFTVTPNGALTGTSQNALMQSTFSPSTPFTLATATSAGDYLLFTGLTGPSFTLTANRTTGDTSSTTFIPINGFQIVGPASVPEASTTVSLGLLLGLGLIGVVAARRRKADIKAGASA